MAPQDTIKNRPLSLRWKWGLLIAFMMIAVLFGATFFINSWVHNRTESEVFQYYDTMYKNVYSKLQQPSEPYHREEQLLTFDSQAQYDVNNYAINYLNAVGQPEVTIRLFDDKNQLVYSTGSIPTNSIDHSGELTPITIDNNVYYVAFRPIYSSSNQTKLGSLQMVVDPVRLDQFSDQLDHYTLIVLIIGFVVSLLTGLFLSHHFLEPLRFINKSLDQIEEDNLSTIIFRKKSNRDEWSELNLHVNNLLDKINSYVTNQKQFVEDVSHELRTPVAIVQGHLKLLDRWGKEDPEVLDESIHSALQEISRMQHLVQEMLDLSRADNVSIDYKDEITEVYSTTEQVFNNFKLIHEDFNFYLDTDYNGEGTYIQALRNHYEQILIILLDNAVKYSKERKEIHVSISKSITQIEIAVQDFGEGMTEEDKSRVFSRFYRVDKSRVREKGGNGLGLSIAQQLVRGYNGNIRVESVLDSGSIFYITFPIIINPRQIFRSKQIETKRSI